jgi:GNAT superfamily N-acetyltransferase
MTLVAEVEGVRAGFIFGAPHPKVPKWQLRTLAFSRPCAVTELYVLPRFRQRGIAQRLMSEVERRFALRGYDWITTLYHEGHRFEADLDRSLGYAVEFVGLGKWLRRPSSIAPRWKPSRSI